MWMTPGRTLSQNNPGRFISKHYMANSLLPYSDSAEVPWISLAVSM